MTAVFNKLKKNVIAGFNLSCVGDERCYSYLPSRNGRTLSDQVSISILKWVDKNFKKYSWNERGSDERQYCSPGIDLPIASVSRSKFGEYPKSLSVESQTAEHFVVFSFCPFT